MDNLNYCLVHFSNLPYQVLLPLYFNLLHLHSILIQRYCNVYQDLSVAPLGYKCDVRVIAHQMLVNSDGHIPYEFQLLNSSYYYEFFISDLDNSNLDGFVGISFILSKYYYYVMPVFFMFVF